jgi:hypothetical protein
MHMCCRYGRVGQLWNASVHQSPCSADRRRSSDSVFLDPDTNDDRIHGVERTCVGVFDVVMLFEVDQGLFQCRLAGVSALRGGASRNDVIADVLVHGSVDPLGSMRVGTNHTRLTVSSLNLPNARFVPVAWHPPSRAVAATRAAAMAATTCSPPLVAISAPYSTACTAIISILAIVSHRRCPPPHRPTLSLQKRHHSGPESGADRLGKALGRAIHIDSPMCVRLSRCFRVGWTGLG